MHFKRLPVWAQILCLLAVASVVTWGFWMAMRDTLCTVETKDWILKRPTRGACFEFWMNRYQATVQTVLSGAIGATGLYFVLKQLRALGDQNEMTRMALASNLRQQEAAERSLRAKAEIGINAYAAATTGLFVELGKTQSTKFDYSEKFDTEKYGIGAQYNADISAALHNDELREAWRVLTKEYNSLLMYVGLSFIRTTPEFDERIAAGFSDQPKDVVDAFVRIHTLSQGLSRLAKRLGNSEE